MKIMIINGPNINLLGKREPGIYGSQSFEDFYDGLVARVSPSNTFLFSIKHRG